MSVLTLLSYPDKRLRLKAEPVSKFDTNLVLLTENMADTMYHHNGIGLAATQINVQLRVAVVDISEDRNQLLVLINPRVINSSGTIVMQEGCLSVPHFREDVQRPSHIELEYQNLRGKYQTLKASDLLAVCIQHEIDHLDGRVFIDHVDSDRRADIERYFTENQSDCDAKKE